MWHLDLTLEGFLELFLGKDHKKSDAGGVAEFSRTAETGNLREAWP